jgi:predicted nucleic acid-binding protein
LSHYLDASVMVALHLPEARSDAVEQALMALDDLLVSEFGAGEVASAIARHVRMGIFTHAHAELAFLAFDDWRRDATISLPVDEADLKTAHRLVRTLNLGLLMPDALHIALAQRHGAVLMTLDTNMARAAATIGVEVSIPA